MELGRPPRLQSMSSTKTGVAPKRTWGSEPPRWPRPAQARYARRFLAAAIAAIALATSVNTVSAKVASPVALGKVTTKVKNRRWLKPAEFRKVVERELEQIDLTQVKTRDRFVLEATITKLETRATSERTEATCIVSGVLARKSGGAVRAILRGRARVQDGPKQVQAAERAAVEGAVRSALSRVEEALQQ
jgi:hypothetical protein